MLNLKRKSEQLINSLFYLLIHYTEEQVFVHKIDFEIPSDVSVLRFPGYDKMSLYELGNECSSARESTAPQKLVGNSNLIHRLRANKPML